MKAKLFALGMIALSAVSTNAFAEGAFVGGTIGVVSTEVDIDNVGKGVFDDRDTVPEIGIKGGYDFDSYRVYGEYDYQGEYDKSLKDEGDVANLTYTSHKFIAGVDWTPEVAPKTKFFIGANAGVAYNDARLAVSSEDGSGTLKSSKTDFLLGARTGVIYKLADNLDAEAGLKAQWMFSDDYKVNNLGGYVGVNYKF